jgi:hypothetical protein
LACPSPGPVATFPDALTGAQIANIRQDHDELKALFAEYCATNKALKQQIIGAVDKLYLRTLNHCITGFANVTTRQMLVHLYTTYCRLTPADVQNNHATMKQPYNPNKPIGTLFHQIEESIHVAGAVGASYTPSQIVAISYNFIFATGMFPAACRKWRRRVTNTRTWHNFKADFAAAHQDYRNSQLTSRQSGYQSSSNAANESDDTAFDIQGTVGAIANLATATPSDRSTVARLAESNAAQNAKIEQQAAQLTTVCMELATLRSELASSKAPTPLTIAPTLRLINDHANSCPTPTIAGHMATPFLAITLARVAPVPKKDIRGKPPGRTTSVPPKEEKPDK